MSVSSDSFGDLGAENIGFQDFWLPGADLIDNQEVAYSNNGDAIGGLDSSFTYFVIKDGTDANKIQLAATSGGSAIDLSTSATIDLCNRSSESLFNIDGQ